MGNARPLDRDRRALVEGEKEGGRRCDASGRTRGGAARDSPELGVPAALGAKSTRAWVRGVLRDTCDLPRAKARHGRGSSDEHIGGGRVGALA
jgi:hypothetical protein